MRTTGVRVAPRPAPRPSPHHDPDPSYPPPEPLPRTKFLAKGVSEEPPAQGTLQVISHSLPSTPLPPSSGLQSQGEFPVSPSPPPKPPRTQSLRRGVSPTQPAQTPPPPRAQRPGLMTVLSPASSAPPPVSDPVPASTPGPGPASFTRPAPSAPRPEAREGGREARPGRPRLPPLSLPPLPTAAPPTVPSGAGPRPRLPSRPSAAQLASSRARAQDTAAPPGPRPEAQAPGEQSPACTLEDFENSCKEVFRSTRVAKEHAARGRHVQAASHYQVALTAVDRVLRAQVLTLTRRESVRQRLFLLQQDVFNLRKEALNGFTDSQTAVKAPRGLSPTTPTPGAPPSYDDVLKEDRLHRPSDDAPVLPSRQPSMRGAASAFRPPPPSALRPRPSSAQRPTVRPPTARNRSNSSGDSRVEMLVDVRGASGPPSSAPPTTHGPNPLVPTRLPAARPKSSYHPDHQPVSLPAQPAAQRRPPLAPMPDEAVLSQLKALQAFGGSGRRAGEGPTTPAAGVHQGEGTVTAAGDAAQPSGDTAQQTGAERTGATLPTRSSVTDPFVSVDPFPPVESRSGNNDSVFLDSSQGHTPARPRAPRAPSPAFSDDFNPRKEDEPWNGVQQKDSSLDSDRLGDSILEALDFAVTRTPGHNKVSQQRSKERRPTRFHSEDNLLDSSYNTLETILHPDRCRRRASIIDEFDPLVDPSAAGDGRKEANKQEDPAPASECPPKPLPRQSRVKSITDAEGGGGTRAARDGKDRYGLLSECHSAEGATALEGTEMRDTTDNQSGAQYLPDEERWTASFATPEDPSVYSWPPDVPVVPLYPNASAIQAEMEEEEAAAKAGLDVGRSAFYRPPSTQNEGKRKDLLRIREGVKIYFIHSDGVITSPCNRPVLTVSRDPNRLYAVGEGLVLNVGDSVWACQMHKKTTLVLRTQTGCYLFDDVADRPECKAVALRVPSNVRRTQQELLSNFLQENTRLEEERPKGITKAISKSASNAATRMNKMVEDRSMTPTQPFVRRNSIRALKGMTKRLNSLAERTGSNLTELPSEYKLLQEAADTLSFSRSAKMIQYI